MARNVSRVTRKGQITIPIEIRRSLGIAEGDEVEFVRNNGSIALQLGHRSSSGGTLYEGLPETSAARRTHGVLAQYAHHDTPMEARLLIEKEAAAEGWTERERRYLARQNEDA